MIDDWKRFLAIKQLVLMGVSTEIQIVEKLHLKGRYVEHAYLFSHVLLAKLPSFVQDEYKKYCEDCNSTTFRLNMVFDLRIKYREGGFYDQDTAFLALWKLCSAKKQMVAIDLLQLNLVDSLRAYKGERVQRIYESILQHGWHPLYSIVVSERLVVLDGDCRFRAILQLKKEQPEKFAEFFPDGEVEVQIRLTNPKT